MAIILLHDLRVDAHHPPRTDIYKAISAHQSIEQAINDLAGEISSNTQLARAKNILHVLAHGGPNGILLGAPGLSQFNPGVFSNLYGKVATIVFHSCAATAVYPGAHRYNGARMCELLSAIVGCTVIGADQTQYLSIDTFFGAGDNVQYAPWQGTVSIYVNGRLESTNTPFQREAGFMP